MSDLLRRDVRPRRREALRQSWLLQQRLFTSGNAIEIATNNVVLVIADSLAGLTTPGGRPTMPFTWPRESGPLLSLGGGAR